MRAESYKCKMLKKTVGSYNFTRDFMFRKSLAQERFKSNFEFRCQIKVSSIKFSKGFAKFMIQIVLFMKYLN